MLTAAAMCLALNLYHEARDQGEDGMRMVAAVTLNRVADSRWPDTVCGVVKQKRAGVCQFSWYCDGKTDTPYEMDDFLLATEIAQEVLLWPNTLPDTTATHYHAVYVHPYWAHKLTFLEQVGDHLFYYGW